MFDEKDAMTFPALDKGTPVPLYYQIKRHIQDMIQNGRLQEGDMLPTEAELCQTLRVSRPTVRQAMGELVAEGLLERKKGKGTFVSRPKIDVRFLQKLESFNQEMQQKGCVPSTSVLALEPLPAEERIGKKLRLSPEDKVIHLARLRFADGEPMVFLDTYIPYAPFPDMLEQSYANHSLYERLEALYGARVFRVTREIEAVNANRREAELLHMEKGEAICLVKTIGYTGEDVPVEYSVARYRGDRNRFSVELYR